MIKGGKPNLWDYTCRLPEFICLTIKKFDVWQKIDKNSNISICSFAVFFNFFFFAKRIGLDDKMKAKIHVLHWYTCVLIFPQQIFRLMKALKKEFIICCNHKSMHNTCKYLFVEALELIKVFAASFNCL